MQEEIRQSIREIARARGLEKSLCPSEVARALAEDWRPLMPMVREVAAEEVKVGLLRVTQGNREVDPVEAHGPIRLRATSKLLNQ